MNRLLVVSNRLPVKVVPHQDGRLSLGFTPGGLSTSLHALMSRTGGEWIGWSGSTEETAAAALTRLGSALPYGIRPFTLTPEEETLFYKGFSNRTLWPLFHDFPTLTTFDEKTWASYVQANRRYAETARAALKRGDLLWVHDYHLFLVAQHLQERPAGVRIGHFNHIPFPQRDLFAKIPWRREILRGILSYDLAGFQSRRDLRNFCECVEELVPDARFAQARAPGHVTISRAGRRCRLGVFPIGIDFDLYDTMARQKRVQKIASRLRTLYPGRKLILGIDRMDYSKGLPNKIRAFERLLEKHPRLRGKVTLIQIAVPTRTEVPEYQLLRAEIDGLIGRINGRFTQAGWVPIHYIYRSLPQEDLIAFYHTSDVGLVTPLKDGMNLVAKEFCAASFDLHGVLILSEFAGAAEALGGSGALMVNPHDIPALAEAIRRALTMPESQQSARMSRLREKIRRDNVGAWARSFLDALEDGSPDHRSVQRRARSR